MNLPTNKKAANASIQTAMGLIYGPNGCGKSTLFAKAPKALFLETEAGADHLDRYSMRITSLAELGEVYAQLKADPSHGFSPIVIDTVDKLYDLVKAAVCAKLGIEDPSESPHGGAWGQINQKLENTISSFQALGAGLWLLGHERVAESGRVTPAMSAGAGSKVCDMVDVIGYVTVDAATDERTVHFKPGRAYKAKARVRVGRVMPDCPLEWDAISEAYEEAQGDS